MALRLCIERDWTFLIARVVWCLIIVGQHIDVGLAIEELLLIWAASEAGEWRNKIGFIPL